uniref:Nardilysin b (N-arginine dibasic convertase) n=1 Tax=Poecilia reticulata TaxID=8081 RepID=A0A3P9NF68_POERE
MPQTKKSVRGAGGASRPGDPEPGDPDPGDPEPGEPPPPSPQEGRLAGGGRGGVELEQGDPDIVKSPSDPKKYRFLELGNGLRVLLISDLSRANENEEGQQEESEGDEEEEDDEEDDEEGESSASSDEEEEEESDEEEEPELMEAAAALCVGVGSFCDPDDLPGLAHFLEHMVFMGSEKFPAENDFDAFLKRHGGSDNASTDCERTVFQFDIQRKFFREALDRWAQFFICPLMVQDALDREVEAVDSEYQLARPSDSHRKEMLFGTAVLIWSGPTTAVGPLFVVPVRKVHALTISWALPPQVKHYRVKPLHYISWLMGHEGTGSILSLLRKRCWALALYGGNSESGFDQNSTYSIFSISVTLTDLGYQNFFQVVHLVFQYLKMLQNLGPQQRIYEEIQKIEDNEFRYQEQTDPIEFVENICENMQLFPKPDLLTGDQLMFHYDPEVIGTALSLLTPLRANLLLLAPENEGSCPLQEKWFGTSYSCDDIPEEWERRWESDFELNPDLHLPAENRFIATDFNLKKSDCPDTEFPVRILALEQGALWYKKDHKFKIPKVGSGSDRWSRSSSRPL